MAEDKYAPKAEEGADVVHKKHWDLIHDQQALNKKHREEAGKPKQAPQNPDAPQNKPVEAGK